MVCVLFHRYKKRYIERYVDIYGDRSLHLFFNVSFLVSIKRYADWFRGDVTTSVIQCRNSGACMSHAFSSIVVSVSCICPQKLQVLVLNFLSVIRKVLSRRSSGYEFINILYAPTVLNWSIFNTDDCLHCLFSCAINVCIVPCSYFPTQTIMSHSRLREVLLPLFLAGFFRVTHEYAEEGLLVVNLSTSHEARRLLIREDGQLP